MDLTTMTATADHLSNEGWKWEPTADGGTLTLRAEIPALSHRLVLLGGAAAQAD